MEVLDDWKEEEFCRLVACGSSFVDAYKEAFNPQCQLATIYVLASRLHSKHHIRIAELRGTLQAASAQAWIAGKMELMQYLTRAIRTPMSEITDESDLCQESTITVFEAGSTTKIKAVNKLGAIQQLAAIAQYTAPSVGNLTINNTLNLNRPESMHDAAKELAELFALPAPQGTVIEAEIVPTPSPSKKQRTKQRTKQTTT